MFRDDEKESAADSGMKAEADETESHMKLCDSQFARAQLSFDIRKSTILFNRLLVDNGSVSHDPKLVTFTIDIRVEGLETASRERISGVTNRVACES